jgi:hypothetical protein
MSWVKGAMPKESAAASKKPLVLGVLVEMEYSGLGPSLLAEAEYMNPMVDSKEAEGKA